MIAEGIVPPVAEPLRDARFKALAERYVFTFAGPCAYTRPRAAGDAAIWFHPDAETGASGGANPFDTGGLEKGKLRPWDARSLDERHAFYVNTESPVPGWRSAFEAWLRAAYTDPRRYLESDKGRVNSGFPDKGDPHGLAAANKGTSDRRAWTWEVRFADRLAFKAVEAMLIPRDQREDATAWKKRVGARSMTIETLDRGRAITADLLFKRSGDFCLRVMGVS